jgi:hypothetical protein
MTDTEAQESLSHSGLPASPNRFFTSFRLNFPYCYKNPDTPGVCVACGDTGTGKRLFRLRRMKV